MCPASVSGIVIEAAPVSYWSVFPLSQVTAPETLTKVNLAAVPFSFLKWLEKELEALHKMSDYGSVAEDSDDEVEEAVEINVEQGIR